MGIQTFDVGERGELFACRLKNKRTGSHEKLVRHHLYGLRKVERAELGARRYVNEVLAGEHLFVREPGLLVAEDERDRPVELTRARPGGAKLEHPRRPLSRPRP